MPYNPFNIKRPQPSKVYLELFNNALKLDHSKFFELVNKDFNFRNDKLFNHIN